MEQNNKQTKYLYSIGEIVLNTMINKQGTIKYLRNDTYEREQRKKDPTHYYYYIDYLDGSFDTYVGAWCLESIDN